MTEKEYQKIQWLTEEGTSNILNQALRSEQNNESIEDIIKSDDVYQEGLQQLRTTMREKKEKLRSFYDKESSNKNLTPLEKEINKFKAAAG